MRILTLEIADLSQSLTAFDAAWQSGEPESGSRIAFTSLDLLWQILMPARWRLLQAMSGQEPMSLAILSDALARPLDNVRDDVTALVEAGMIQSVGGGMYRFPFDAIHVDFMLRAA